MNIKRPVWGEGVLSVKTVDELSNGGLLLQATRKPVR
jgi:hypothetical protein